MTTYVAYKGPIKIYKEVVPRKKQKEKKKATSDSHSFSFAYCHSTVLGEVNRTLNLLRIFSLTAGKLKLPSY